MPSFCYFEKTKYFILVSTLYWSMKEFDKRKASFFKLWLMSLTELPISIFDYTKIRRSELKWSRSGNFIFKFIINSKLILSRLLKTGRVKNQSVPNVYTFGAWVWTRVQRVQVWPLAVIGTLSLWIAHMGDYFRRRIKLFWWSPI